MKRFEQQLDRLIDNPTMKRIEPVDEAFQELSARDKISAFEMIEGEREIAFEDDDEGVEVIDFLLEAIEKDYLEAIEEVDVEGSMNQARNIISHSGMTNPGAMLSLTRPFVDQLPSTKKKKYFERLAAFSKNQGRRSAVGNGLQGGEIGPNIMALFNRIVQGNGNPDTHAIAIVNILNSMNEDDATDTAYEIEELIDDYDEHPDKQLLQRLNILDVRLSYFTEPKQRQGGALSSTITVNEQNSQRDVFIQKINDMKKVQKLKNKLSNSFLRKS